MKGTCIRRGARARLASFASKARIWRRCSASPTSASHNARTPNLPFAGCGIPGLLIPPPRWGRDWEGVNAAQTSERDHQLPAARHIIANSGILGNITPTLARPIKGSGTRSADSGELSSRWRDIVAPLRGGCRFVKVGVGKAVEASAAPEDLAADLGGDAGVGQHPRRHLGETGVEVREIARYANVVSAAQQLDGGADLSLAALDRRKAIPLPIFERRQLQIRGIGVMVLTQIPLDAPQQPGNPPALRFQESDFETRMEFEDAAEHQRNQRKLHFGRMAGDMPHE